MESQWTLREQLILSSAVQKSGDQNWVSVTRAIKPLMEAKRPPEFFSQKNCAMQYAKMLDRASAPKRLKKRSTSRADSHDSDGGGETAQDVIVRQLTEKRIAELDVLLGRIKEEYLHLKVRVEQLQKGELSEKEMQSLLEELTSLHSRSGDVISSAAHSPLGMAPEEHQTEPVADGMESAEQLSQIPQSGSSTTTTTDAVKELAATGQSAPVQHASLPPQHTPASTTPAVSAPGVMASATPETKQPLPSKAGESPNTDTLAQIKSPLSVDTSPSHNAPQPERGEPNSEDTQVMEVDSGKETIKGEGFLANIGWYEVEHAYASKPPSPSVYKAEPASNDTLGSTPVVPGPEAAEMKLELDATQVSTVKSMEVAMGVLDGSVVVSEDMLSRRRPGLPTSPDRELVKSPHADETKDSEASLSEEKTDAGQGKAPETPEESVTKELKETMPPPQDPDSKEHPTEKEATVVDLEGEQDADAAQPKGSVASPKPDDKGRSQTPEIDVESLASSPLAQDDEGEGPSEGVSTSSRRRNRSKQSRRRDRRDRDRARQRSHKREQEGVVSERPVKVEDRTPSKDEEDEGHGGGGDDKDTPSRPDKQSSRDRSRSSKRNTRSAAKGASKKEESEVEEEEEAPVVTLRRSTRGRDKQEEKTEAAQDSEVDDTASNSTMTSAVNSPAPSHGEMSADQLLAYKAWKRAIMLVWRQIAQHKYANLFLQPVKDDEATGYSEVVHRPMDLTSIKKNIEGGVVRTDIEFQRDILLMFQNALMYNSSDHDVYKMAEEMRADAMEHIHDYLATQLIMQSSSSKPTLRTRRGEGQDKGEEEGSSSRKPSRRPSLEDTPAKRKKQ